MSESSEIAAPNWLSPDELRAWMTLTAVLIKLPSALDVQLQRDAGLSHFEYLVLAGLSDAPERMLPMSRLALFANGSLSRLSHVVKRLETRGWIRRKPSAQDGRITMAELTDEGFAKLAASAPGHVEAARGYVIDALTPEQISQLREIGEAILERVDPAESCPTVPKG
ncbi:MarR family winged helix-turn-helix transcriptional regulator [Kribbella deserti]|uniref:MarR family winged helix-turn-helix transcriptional regulator n=1 Tax=Kribbella deserti TaxID=1926257 RepID=A0ABV6QEG0_9ACTN